MDRKLELDNCNFVKAILMMAVVLQHSMAIYTGVWGPFSPAESSAVFNALSGWISSFHIFGFVLVSGYIFYYIKFERGGYDNYVAFILNKAQRLLVPCAFVAIVWVIPINLFFFPEESIIQKFILGNSPRQLWFLLMLFWVFVFFWPLARFVDRHPLIGGLVIASLYVVGICLPSYYCIDRGFQYMVYFYVGFMIRKNTSINSLLYKVPIGIYLIIHLALFMGNRILSNQNGMVFKIFTMGSGLVLHIFGAVGVFVLFQRIANHRISQTKIIKALSMHSFTIYLFHQQIIYFSLMFINGAILPIGVVAVNFAVAICASTIISILMSNSKITSYLIGVKCK